MKSSGKKQKNIMRNIRQTSQDGDGKVTFLQCLAPLPKGERDGSLRHRAAVRHAGTAAEAPLRPCQLRSLLSGGPSGGKAVSRVSAKTSSLLAGSPGPNEGCLPQAMSWNMCKGRARGPAPHAYTTKRLSRATSSRTILNSTGLSSRTPVRLGSAIRALQVSARSHTASRARTEPTPTARQ